MNNLTTTDLSRIFGERIGQEFMYKDSTGSFKSVIEKVEYTKNDDVDNLWVNGTWTASLCKLLLTPLENISDEDAIDLIRISSFYSGGIKLININVSGGIIHIDFEWADEERIFTKNIKWTLTWKEAEFIRNKGYDYQGLIEKGVAIEKPIYGESPFKEAVKEVSRQVEIDRIRNSRK